METGSTPARDALPFRPMLRGLRRRCPHSGGAPLFRGYLKAVRNCVQCDTRFGHIRTDDIAPYFTILIVGHIMAPLLLFT